MIGKNVDVVIVGAGIAGCVVALHLASAGRTVLIIEQAREVARMGPDFVKPRGVETLKRLGLLDELMLRGAIKRSVIRYFHDGDPIIDYDLETHSSTGYYLIVPYGTLLKVVMERLASMQGVEIWFGATATELNLTADGRAQVVLADGRSRTSSVVIGADGTNSRVREMSGIGATRQSYEQVMHLATLPLVPSVAQCNRLYLSSQRRAAYFYPIGTDQMRVTSVGPSTERALFQSELGWAVRQLRQFVSESDDVLAAMQESIAFQTVPLGRMHAIAYHRANVALVGNSLLEVHPMTGQGMSLAFEDATSLSSHLESFFRGQMSLDAALTCYSDERRPINTAMLEYSDRLYHSFENRERYLSVFDPRAHGDLH
ncbi:MAG TPA: FAD-dependent oxidoreductase [Polyangium sp.]|nr:FAD-dependent oxidoreductase [Polyangium sp.]